MQFRQLEYFVSLAETLNFTRTAQDFFVSQTAVTQAIKTLEAELGAPLFIRSKRHVELTAAGHALREDAALILRQIRDTAARIKTLSGEINGTLRVGYLRGAEYEGLGEALHLFHEWNPNVQLSLEAGSVVTLIRELRQGQLDIIFTHLYKSRYPGFETRKIAECPLMLICRNDHPLASLPSVRAGDLKGYPSVHMAHPDDESGELSAVTRFYGGAGFYPQSTFLSDSIETNVFAVAIGLGYGLLPSYVTQRLHPDVPVAIRPIIGCEKELTVGAMWKSDNENPLIKRFWDVCAMKMNR